MRECAEGWNVFVHSHAPLWCIVPATEPVPKLVLSGDWGFGAHLRNPTAASPLSRLDVREGVRRVGFHVLNPFEHSRVA